MVWVDRDQLSVLDTVEDFEELLQVMERMTCVSFSMFPKKINGNYICTNTKTALLGRVATGSAVFYAKI